LVSIVVSAILPFVAHEHIDTDWAWVYKSKGAYVLSVVSID